MSIRSSACASLHLRGPGRLGAGAAARQRGCPAGVLEKRLDVLVRQAQFRIECVAIMKPGQCSRPEGIARADRVHNLYRRGWNADLGVSRCAVRSRGSECDQDEADTNSEDSFGRSPIVELRVKPCQIVRARLDD